MKNLIINSVESYNRSEYVQSTYISAYDDYIHHYSVDVVINFELDNEPFYLVFQQQETISSMNPLHLCNSVSINSAVDDDQDKLLEILNESDWNEVYGALQSEAQVCFDDAVEHIKMKHRYAQLTELKDSILQELRNNKFKSAMGVDRFIDADEFQLQAYFEEFATSYQRTNSNPYYLEIKDYLNEAAQDFAIEAIELREQTLNDEFEELFLKASKYSNLDTKLFIRFVNLVHEKVLGETLDKPVNIWHIKQNELKTYESGRESIKKLCREKYENIKREWDINN